jgi:hypothetical protein
MQVGEDHHIPQSHCLSCGEVLDGATCVGSDNKPSPGDVFVCIECGHIMAFDQGLKFRELTNEESVAIAGDPYLLAIQRGRKHAMDRHELRRNVASDSTPASTDSKRERDDR